MIKSYETYATKMKDYVSLERNQEEIQKIAAAANDAATNNRLSDYGKQMKITSVKNELENLVKTISDPARNLLKQFCEEYDLAPQEDGKDHTADIANALKIIEMCGANITADLFRAAIEPLQGSYKALKLVNDIITVRYGNQATEEYSQEMRDIIRNYTGSNIEADSYIEDLNRLKAMIEYPALIDYRMTSTERNGVLNFRIEDKTRYSVYCLPDEMIRIGERHDELAKEYPLLFNR